MKRRDVLKGAAAVAGAAVVGLPAMAEGKVPPLLSTTYNGQDRRMMVELHVYPDADGKLKGRFQELIEEWERIHEGFRPVEAVLFEPQTEDGSPWLRHPAWEPLSEDTLSMLYTESRIIFREKRWGVIERAINLREMGYWRQEYGPQFEGMIDGGGMSPGTSHLLMFRRVARARLHHVVVRFEAIPLSELKRYCGAVVPGYAELEDEVEALEALRAKGKLSPRAYYQLRNERFDKLGQIEEAALKWG